MTPFKDINVPSRKELVEINGQKILITSTVVRLQTGHNTAMNINRHETKISAL